MLKFCSLLILLFVFNYTFAQNEASIVSPLINQYQADENMLNRKYALKRSDEYFKRMETFYTAWLTKLKSLPFEKLSVNERVDYILLKRDINVDARSLQENYSEFKSTSFSVPFAPVIIDFEQKRRIGKQQDGEATSKKFDAQGWNYYTR
ncbi:MAG: hypothetical protein EOO07_21510, partial [Chitinophagaceae bacterium]